MVGAQLEGFDVMVALSNEAPFMVIEGDEYLSSPLDPRPKFHIYRPHIALISGIAWDHINVFPSFEMYLDQFRRFIHHIENYGKLIYCAEDDLVKAICEEEATEAICLYPYHTPKYHIMNGKVVISHKGKEHHVKVFGQHNLQNLAGARLVCLQLGVTDEMFYEAIESYKGASRRLEMIYQKNELVVFRDFAHAPSKITASTKAVKEFHQGKRLIACMELHTYSSLNEQFLSHYKGSLDVADEAIVFYDPHAVRLKKLPDLDPDLIIKAFDLPGLKVFTDTDSLYAYVSELPVHQAAYLFMSSGNFGGFNFNDFFATIDKRLE